jgi:hypothetical protein
MLKKNTFEETYPRYPFAPLIDLVFWIADAYIRWRNRRHGGKTRPAPRYA